MKEQPKKLWLEGLDTKNQTKSCLYDAGENAYCCLGVLTECYLQDTGKSWAEVTQYFSTSNRYGLQQCLPEEVVEWAGLETDDPLITISENKKVYLSSLNDEFNFSFKQIRGLIERQL